MRRNRKLSNAYRRSSTPSLSLLPTHWRLGPTSTTRRNDKVSGHIRRSGKASWELKFSVNGERQYRSFKGTKREAIAEMTRLMASALAGNYVDSNKITVGEFFARWQ